MTTELDRDVGIEADVDERPRGLTWRDRKLGSHQDRRIRLQIGLGPRLVERATRQVGQGGAEVVHGVRGDDDAGVRSLGTGIGSVTDSSRTAADRPSIQLRGDRRSGAKLGEGA